MSVWPLRAATGEQNPLSPAFRPRAEVLPPTPCRCRHPHLAHQDLARGTMTACTVIACYCGEYRPDEAR